MGTRRSHLVLAVTAVLAAGLLSACADPDSPGAPGTPDAPLDSSSPVVPPTVSPPATAHPPMPSPDPEAILTVTGQVVDGVEINCLLLRTDAGEEYLLIGGDDEVRAEQTATVRGYPDPTLLTTCQQGTPFVVTEVVSP